MERFMNSFANTPTFVRGTHYKSKSRSDLVKFLGRILRWKELPVTRLSLDFITPRGYLVEAPATYKVE
jgi:hypothetical protein